MTGALERENRDLRLQLGAIVHAAKCRDWRTVADECAGVDVEFDGADPVAVSRCARSVPLRAGGGT